MAESSLAFGNPDDNNDIDKVTFVSADGGQPDPELVERVKNWLTHSPIGQQLFAHMRGEGPEPAPLFTAVGYEDGDRRLLLEDGSVDITDADLDSRVLLDGLFDKPKPSE